MIVNVNKVTFRMGEIITSQTEIAKRMEKIFLETMILIYSKNSKIKHQD